MQRQKNVSAKKRGKKKKRGNACRLWLQLSRPLSQEVPLNVAWKKDFKKKCSFLFFLPSLLPSSHLGFAGRIVRRRKKGGESMAINQGARG